MPRKLRKGGVGVIQNFVDDNKGVLQPAYETTAVIGKVYSVLSALGGTLIAVIFLALGIWMVRMGRDKTGSAKATVTEATCNPTDKTCYVTVEYTVDDKKYTNSYASSAVVNKGQTVNIKYNPENPNDIFAESGHKTMGWIFILVAVISIIMIWAWVIFTLFFKPVAAATGVGAVVDAVIPE